MRADSLRKTARALIAAAEKHQIALQHKTNAELICRYGFTSGDFAERAGALPDFAIFWDKDVRLAAYLEKQGIKVYNSAHAIELCDDKSLMYDCLAQHGISIPKTVLAPKTYAGCGYDNDKWLELVISDLGFPLVAKECFGSWGEQVYLVSTEADLRACLSVTASRPVLFQEFIEESYGCDIRIYVVGSNCAVALRRQSPAGVFSSARMAGSQVVHCALSSEEKNVALDAIKALTLDFGSVDLFCVGSRNPLVCEVNSNAQFNAVRQIDNSVSIAEEIICHINEDIKGR